MPGNRDYTVVFSDHVTAKDIPALSSPVRKTLRHAIETRLTIAPLQYGKPLRGSLKGFRWLRAGDYRIVYSIHETKRLVYVVAIGHRRDIYKRFGH